MKNIHIKISIFLYILITYQLSFSQVLNDKLILVDKSSIECKVLYVKDNSIEIDPEGSIPFQIIERNKVAYIVYSDNTVVKMQPSTSNNVENNNSKVENKSTENETFKDCEGGTIIFNHIRDHGDPVLHKWRELDATDEKLVRLCKNVVEIKSHIEFTYRQSGIGMLNERLIETSTIKIKIIVTNNGRIDTPVYSKSFTFPQQMVSVSNGSTRKEMPKRIIIDVDKFELYGQEFIIQFYFGNVRYEGNGDVGCPIGLKFSTFGWIDPELGY